MRQYKKHLSDYPSWEPRSHADKWLIFPENLGPRLSIDESSLSRGELYTIVTNKDGHGGKGTLVAIIEGVKAVEVSRVLKKLPRQARHRVLEITLDMSGSMHAIARECFPNAEQVIDRFHVQKLACDALQELRIEHRWEAINEETNEMEQARLEVGSTGLENSVTGKPGKRSCSVPGCCYSRTRRRGALTRGRGLPCFSSCIPTSERRSPWYRG